MLLHEAHRNAEGDVMHDFERIFEAATAAIDPDYFLLPVSGREHPIYRERVYCYELYHQIRVRWPGDTRHTLAGEIDKSGHPLIRGNGLDNCKPDFLVHLPGEMEGNYAAIEVKPVTAKRRGRDEGSGDTSGLHRPWWV